MDTHRDKWTSKNAFSRPIALCNLLVFTFLFTFYVTYIDHCPRKCDFGCPNLSMQVSAPMNLSQLVLSVTVTRHLFWSPILGDISGQDGHRYWTAILSYVTYMDFGNGQLWSPRSRSIFKSRNIASRRDFEMLVHLVPRPHLYPPIYSPLESRWSFIYRISLASYISRAREPRRSDKWLALY